MDASASRRAEAARWLLSRIDYERNETIPYRSGGLKLDRMHRLVARLNNPERSLHVVHVAGTKGKGSTSSMIASVLTAAGLRTGLYTSPHIDCIEERLVVDGRACSAENLASLVERVRPVVEAMDEEIARDRTDSAGPSYFEITTAMAMLYFADAQVDIAVLEVGLGGRLDSTNVCVPMVSVITSISFDHMEQLGDTLTSIAWEKAGIIKSGVPVVSGVQNAEAQSTIRRVASERGSRLVELNRDFQFSYHAPPPEIQYEYLGAGRPVAHYALSLLGRHQGANAAVALATLEELRRSGWTISEEAMGRGLQQTRLPARIEVVSREPTVIVDAAHNVASTQALADVLEESFADKERTLIFGTSREKDARGMLECLAPCFNHLVLTRYQKNPRFFDPAELEEIVTRFGHPSHCVRENSADAWDYVRGQTGPRGLVCIAGSFYLAAEMRRLIAARPLESVPNAALRAV